MEARAEFLIDYAEEHGPVTVRRSTIRPRSHGLPGIDKTDNGYDKIQAKSLTFGAQARLDYEHIADMTRWMRKPRSFNGVEQALADTARLYRKSLWNDARNTLKSGARRMRWRA